MPPKEGPLPGPEDINKKEATSPTPEQQAVRPQSLLGRPDLIKDLADLPMRQRIDLLRGGVMFTENPQTKTELENLLILMQDKPEDKVTTASEKQYRQTEQTKESTQAKTKRESRRYQKSGSNTEKEQDEAAQVRSVHERVDEIRAIQRRVLSKEPRAVKGSLLRRKIKNIPEPIDQVETDESGNSQPIQEVVINDLTQEGGGIVEQVAGKGSPEERAASIKEALEMDKETKGEVFTQEQRQALEQHLREIQQGDNGNNPPEDNNPNNDPDDVLQPPNPPGNGNPPSPGTPPPIPAPGGANPPGNNPPGNNPPTPPGGPIQGGPPPGGGPPGAGANQGPEIPTGGERTLEIIDRDIRNHVRYLGEWNTRNVNWRRSPEGEAELRRLQGSIVSFVRERLGRGGSIERVEETINQLRRAILAAPAQDRRIFQDEISRYINITEDRRHRQLDIQLQGLDLNQTQARINVGVPRYQRMMRLADTSVRRLNEERQRQADQLRVNQEALERLRQEPQPTTPLERQDWLQREIDLREALTATEDRINAIDQARDRLSTRRDVHDRRINSLYYAHAQKRLDQQQFQIFKAYIDAQKRYGAIGTEIRNSLSGNISANREFRFERDATPNQNIVNFTEIRSRYESGHANSKREARNRRVMESYLREAEHRGYLGGLERGINNLVRNLARQMQSTDPNRTIEEIESYIARGVAPQQVYDAIIRQIDTLLNQTGPNDATLQGIVNNGQRLANRDPRRDRDWQAFIGVSNFYLERAKDYFLNLSNGRILPNPELGIEFRLGQEGNMESLWDISYAGYYEIRARSREEFDFVMNSFSRFLTSGAIDRDPNNMFQELRYFEKSFMARARIYFNDEPAQLESWRIQLKARMGVYSAEYFAALGQTDNVRAILKFMLEGLDGMTVMSELMKSMKGKTGLAVRFMDKGLIDFDGTTHERMYNGIFQYSGENGFFATESNEFLQGTLEYQVRDRTLENLAEDIMIYDLSEHAPGADIFQAAGEGLDDRGMMSKNLSSLINFQTNERFIRRFKPNEELKAIRDLIRQKKKITPEQRKKYDRAYSDAREAVSLAFQLQNAFGERARKAAPSYVIDIPKRNENGKATLKQDLVINNHVYDRNQFEVGGNGELLDPNGVEWERKDFHKWIEDRRKRGQNIPQFYQDIYESDTRKIKFIKSVEDRQKKQEEFEEKKMAGKIPSNRPRPQDIEITDRELDYYLNLNEDLSTDDFITLGDPELERTDYVSADLSIRYSQFTDNLAKIMFSLENQRRRAAGQEPLTGWHMSVLSESYRAKAYEEIYRNGLKARVVNENGEELYFQRTTLNPQKEAALRNKFEHEAKRLFGAGAAQNLINDYIEDKVTKQRLINLEKARTRPPGLSDEELRQQGWFTLDFDDAANQVISHWNGQTYLAQQHEIRGQLLGPKIRAAALRIRRGESSAEEEDILASMLLQIDPTLENLRGTPSDDDNIELINSFVNTSYRGHWRIVNELDRQFIDFYNPERTMYYGIPNERFSYKELIWSAKKLAREQKDFARRAWPLLAESPVHFPSLADSMGGDTTWLTGIFERQSPLVRNVEKEATDSNVLVGWINNMELATEVHARFAKGGKLPNGQEITANGMKPFNDLDSAVTYNWYLAATHPDAEIQLYQSLREKNCGRISTLLQSIERQDNAAIKKGALTLDNKDIRYNEKGYASLVYYDENTGALLRMGGRVTIPIKDPANRDVGTGAQEARQFLRHFTQYATFLGVRDYPAQAWIIYKMGMPMASAHTPGGFRNFWHYLEQKDTGVYI